jgi:hypothetical protein
MQHDVPVDPTAAPSLRTVGTTANAAGHGAARQLRTWQLQTWLM